MEIESLRHFKKEYEKRKPFFPDEGAAIAWKFFILLNLASRLSIKEIDEALSMADASIAETGFSLTVN